MEPVLARSPPAVRLFAAEPAPPPLPLTPPPASPPAAAAVRKSHADAASASVQKARSMASSERFALGSSSSALLESVMEESDLDELMSIPKLPFEIVDEGGPPDTLTASAPASSGSLRAPPVPDQTLRPPLPVTPPPQERRKSKRSDHKVAKQVSDGPRVPTMSIQRIDKALINTDLDGRGSVYPLGVLCQSSHRSSPRQCRQVVLVVLPVRAAAQTGESLGGPQCARVWALLQRNVRVPHVQ